MVDDQMMTDQRGIVHIVQKVKEQVIKAILPLDIIFIL